MNFSFEFDSIPVLIGTAALVLWATGERLLHFFGLHQQRPTEREALSYYWLALTFYAAIVSSLFDAATLHWTTLDSKLAVLQYAGVPLLLVGLVGRIVSRLALGSQFSGYVQTTADHRLVTTGIYGVVRHPAYLAYLCLLIGFPLTFGSLLGLGCALASGVPALVYRIRIEENALQRWFPDEYPGYQASTYRLIPFLW